VVNRKKRPKLETLRAGALTLWLIWNIAARAEAACAPDAGAARAAKSPIHAASVRSTAMAAIG